MFNADFPYIFSYFAVSPLSECMQMMFFDVFIPTLDVYGDASLVIPWYYKGHHLYYAAFMTIPMILNYLFTTYKWWSLEKTSDKKWSWILVTLQLWQQWRAIKIIYLLFKRNPRAHEKKKQMLKELSSIEPFLESMPAILIMSCIWIHAMMTAKGCDSATSVAKFNRGEVNCTDLLRPLVYPLCNRTRN